MIYFKTHHQCFNYSKSDNFLQFWVRWTRDRSGNFLNLLAEELVRFPVRRNVYVSNWNPPSETLCFFLYWISVEHVSIYFPLLPCSVAQTTQHHDDHSGVSWRDSDDGRRVSRRSCGAQIYNVERLSMQSRLSALRSYLHHSIFRHYAWVSTNHWITSAHCRGVYVYVDSAAKYTRGAHSFCAGARAVRNAWVEGFFQGEEKYRIRYQKS